jgi:hypothetical protein
VPSSPKPPLRTRSITAKVTEDEHLQLRSFALSQGQSLSELARELLLSRLQGDPTAHALLAELLALRAILLNLVYALGRGETPNGETMRELIARSDAEKLKKARELLNMAAKSNPAKFEKEKL